MRMHLVFITCVLAENGDYSPIALPSTGTISSSNTRSTHTFEILNDISIESPETFFMHVMITGTTPPSLNASADPFNATAQILDDDGMYYQSLTLLFTTCSNFLTYSTLHQF